MKDIEIELVRSYLAARIENAVQHSVTTEIRNMRRLKYSRISSVNGACCWQSKVLV